MAVQHNSNQKKGRAARDYSDRTSYNGVKPKGGQIIVPFVTTKKDFSEMDLDQSNLATWLIAGHKIVVGFTVYPKERFEVALKLFDEGVHEEIKRQNNPYYELSGDISLEGLMEGLDDPDKFDFNDTTQRNSDNDQRTEDSILNLIQYYHDNGQIKEAKILTEMLLEYQKGEVADDALSNLKKSQAYDTIKKVQTEAEIIFEEKFDYRD